MRPIVGFTAPLPQASRLTKEGAGPAIRRDDVPKRVLTAALDYLPRGHFVIRAVLLIQSGAREQARPLLC
jgi:hypothetical protein